MEWLSSVEKIFADGKGKFNREKLNALLSEIEKNTPLKNICSEFEENYFGQNGSIKGIDFSEIDLKEKVPKPERKSDPCHKILYAMAWKNGDLGKEEYILKGYSEYVEKKEEFVAFTNNNISIFYQFGGFLKTYSKAIKEAKDDFSEVEPIADRHTFRAYLYFVEEEMKSLPKKTVPKRFAKDKSQKHPEKDYWTAYREWYKETVKDCGNTEKEFWDLNKVMFVLGKAIKR